MEAMLAVPLGCVERSRLQEDVARVIDHAQERQVEEIVVGMPLSLNGQVGPQAKKVQRFVKALKAKTDLPIETMDERYSTVEAQRLLQQSGRKPSRHKGQVDAAAATVILQDYLDRFRTQSGAH